MEITHPKKTSGNENLTTARSNETTAGKRTRIRGYIHIRWYQQRVQGGKLITSLKNKLPTVAIQAVTQENTMRPNFDLNTTDIYPHKMSKIKQSGKNLLLREDIDQWRK